MIKIKNLFPLLVSVLLFISCEDEPVDFIPYVEEELIEEPSVNDPQSSGLPDGCALIIEPSQPYENIELPEIFPDSLDLSSLMPPVRSQGSQGSCTAWATTYYLKSYQEKIQYSYEYETFADVISPAFVFNLSKEAGDCSKGACIENALHVLKSKGATSWQDFPYNDNTCTATPTSNLLALAEPNKIESYHALVPFVQSETYTLQKVIKSLLIDEKPVILAMKLDSDFKSSTPRNADDIYIYQTYNDAGETASHAMLIVGYNDSLNAFKVINSWGTGWGNDGYCYVSYNFFTTESNPDFEEGLLELYFTVDKL